jgi:hypothetical protein
MEQLKRLSSDIFSEFQDKTVPIEHWIVKTENLASRQVFSPYRGLLLYYNRTHTHKNDEPREYTHIWLCGVKRECRQQGVLRTMLRSMLNDPKCCETISVHLNRKKFPEMTKVLSYYGFEWVEDIPKKNLERFEIKADKLKKKIMPF